MRVLLTNAGRRTYLLDFLLDPSWPTEPIEVFAADCDPWVPTFHFDSRVRTVRLPPVLENPARYLDGLRAAAGEHRIDLIIPTSDLDLDILANARESLLVAGTRIAVSSPQAVAACMDKTATEVFCRAHDLPFPRTWASADGLPDSFPLVRKDNRGSASSGFALIESAHDLLLFDTRRHILQEHLVGPEYGVDILNDFSGRFVAACVKRKILMRAGETDRSMIVSHAGIDALARRISAALGHIGNLDVDLMEGAQGRLFCLDFNPRFGGGYPATHLAGMNFLAALVDMTAGRTPRLPAAPTPIVMMKGISLHAAPLPA